MRIRRVWEIWCGDCGDWASSTQWAQESGAYFGINGVVVMRRAAHRKGWREGDDGEPRCPKCVERLKEGKSSG
jgi:hypothetical protein